MFIQRLFDLPEWVLYVEMVVYATIIAFGIIPALFRLRKRFQQMGPAKHVWVTVDTEEIEKHRAEVITNFYENDPAHVSEGTKKLINDILKSVDIVEDNTDLETMKVVELKELAKLYEIKNWWTLKKAELIEALKERM